ncbi:unnamed protein product, partial [Closterium sp. NIES-54]
MGNFHEVHLSPRRRRKASWLSLLHRRRRTILIVIVSLFAVHGLYLFTRFKLHEGVECSFPTPSILPFHASEPSPFSKETNDK